MKIQQSPVICSYKYLLLFGQLESHKHAIVRTRKCIHTDFEMGIM